MFFTLFIIISLNFCPNWGSYRGCLLPIGGELRRTTFAHWTWRQNAIAGCRGRRAIAECHCSVLWLRGRGAIAGCHCSIVACYMVPMLGAVAGCHCGVIWLTSCGAIAGRGAIAGWKEVTNFDCADVVPLLQALAGCHCRVLWLGEGGAMDGAIAGCHCSARWLGEVMTNFAGVDVGCYGWGGDDQFWQSGRGAIAGCHCSVGGKVTTNFGGVDVLPLAEWMWCHCKVPLL